MSPSISEPRADCDCFHPVFQIPYASLLRRATFSGIFPSEFFLLSFPDFQYFFLANSYAAHRFIGTVQLILILLSPWSETASWIEANSICCLRWWRVFRDKTHLSGAWDLTSQTPLTRSGVAPHLCSASRPGKLQSCPVSLEPTRRRRWASPCPTYWGHPGNNNAVRSQRIQTKPAKTIFYQHWLTDGSDDALCLIEHRMSSRLPEPVEPI